MVTFRGAEPQTLLAPAICAAPAPARFSRGPVAPVSGSRSAAARRPRGAQRVRARPRGAPCRPARRRRWGAWLKRAGPRGRTSSGRGAGLWPPPGATQRRWRRGGARSGAVAAKRESEKARLRPPGRRGRGRRPRHERYESRGARLCLQPEPGAEESALTADLDDCHSGGRESAHSPQGQGARSRAPPPTGAAQVARELRLSARSADGRGPEAGKRRAREARGARAPWSAGRGDARRRRREEEARGDPGAPPPAPTAPSAEPPAPLGRLPRASASPRARPRLLEPVPTQPTRPGSRHPPYPPLEQEAEPLAGPGSSSPPRLAVALLAAGVCAQPGRLCRGAWVSPVPIPGLVPVPTLERLERGRRLRLDRWRRRMVLPR
ncbi:uncharacterized protein LOC144368998 isoform X2 [Ictidomys tridecemlineatus]